MLDVAFEKMFYYKKAAEHKKCDDTTYVTNFEPYFKPKEEADSAGKKAVGKA